MIKVLGSKTYGNQIRNGVVLGKQSANITKIDAGGIGSQKNTSRVAENINLNRSKINSANKSVYAKFLELKNMANSKKFGTSTPFTEYKYVDTSTIRDRQLTNSEYEEMAKNGKLISYNPPVIQCTDGTLLAYRMSSSSITAPYEWRTLTKEEVDHMNLNLKQYPQHYKFANSGDKIVKTFPLTIMQSDGSKKEMVYPFNSGYNVEWKTSKLGAHFDPSHTYTVKKNQDVNVDPSTKAQRLLEDSVDESINGRFYKMPGYNEVKLKKQGAVEIRPNVWKRPDGTLVHRNVTELLIEDDVDWTTSKIGAHMNHKKSNSDK